jgi:tetratricopeptide (TPR) repeat protein
MRDLARESGDDDELTAALAGSCTAHIDAARYEQALEMARQMLVVAERKKSPGALADAQHAEGWTLFWTGDFSDSLAALDRAITLCPDGAGAAILEASVKLAEELKTPRESWMGRSALGKVLVALGRDKEAESEFMKAAATIEAVGARLKTPALVGSFLVAQPVCEVYKILGGRPPEPAS